MCMQGVRFWPLFGNLNLYPLARLENEMPHLMEDSQALPMTSAKLSMLQSKNPAAARPKMTAYIRARMRSLMEGAPKKRLTTLKHVRSAAGAP